MSRSAGGTTDPVTPDFNPEIATTKKQTLNTKPAKSAEGTTDPVTPDFNPEIVTTKKQTLNTKPAKVPKARPIR